MVIRLWVDSISSDTGGVGGSGDGDELGHRNISENTCSNNGHATHSDMILILKVWVTMITIMIVLVVVIKIKTMIIIIS